MTDIYKSPSLGNYPEVPVFDESTFIRTLPSQQQGDYMLLFDFLDVATAPDFDLVDTDTYLFDVAYGIEEPAVHLIESPTELSARKRSLIAQLSEAQTDHATLRGLSEVAMRYKIADIKHDPRYTDEIKSKLEAASLELSQLLG